MTLSTVILTTALLASGGAPVADAERNRFAGWDALLDAVRADPGAAAMCGKLLAAARTVAATPIVKRVYKYEDLGRFRSTLHQRHFGPHASAQQTLFALAKSDCDALTTLDQELPLLATAYRWTGDQGLFKRTVAQLEELASWSPLQRPGWSLNRPSSKPLPPDFRDGNWLATGWGVRALADTLEIMPVGSLPPPLIDKLRSLLAREIASIVDDWRTKRTWFIRSNDARTNQWILPTEGLVRACLVLGRDQYAAEYDLGVRNLLAALDAQGPAGECYEGLMYAAMSVQSLLHTAHAMAVAGDRRAADHPFLRRFPTWMAHHLQPGQAWINCFDARVLRDDRCRELLSLLLLLNNDPVARWTLSYGFSGPADDYVGVAGRGVAGDCHAPSLFAAYTAACRVNWRSSWDADATGLWVRGGHPLDGHDHLDRGHVNFILRGRPLLIEAGTPDYGNPQIRTLYQAVVGHNVLEVVGSKTTRQPAPIRVLRLDAAGGEITVDPTPGYSGVKQWQRRVVWTVDRLEVTDEVRFPPDRPQTALFRWHLATQADVKPVSHEQRITVAWDDVTMTHESSVPVSVTTELLPDNTVRLGRQVGADFLHRCVSVQTSNPGAAWTLRTTVLAGPSR